MKINAEYLKKDSWFTAGLFILFFLVFLLFLHGLPLALDDYLFRSEEFESADQVLHYLLEFGNGRFFGNGGSILLLHYPTLSNLVRAAVLAGITVFLPLALALRSRCTKLFSMFLFLTIAPGIYGQVYSWMSGFQNYAPPLLLLLITVLLIRRAENMSQTARACCCFPVFLLGICMQFYIEHSSCLNVLTALLMVLWTRKKNTFKVSLFFLAGTLAGLACMFYAMFFVAPEVHGEVESYFAGGFLGVAKGLLRNAVILLGMYSENAIALGALAILCSLLLTRYPETVSGKTRPLLNLGMLGPSAVFLLSLIGSVKPFYGKLAIAESALLLAFMLVYMGSVSCALFCLAKKTGRQNILWATVLFAMALVSIVPILAVWPTGYRCLFHSSVMLFGAVLLLVEEALKGITKADGMRAVAVSAAAALFITVLCQTAIFTDIRRMVSIRREFLHEQAYLGADSAEFFLIPSPYVYEAWNEEKQHSKTYYGQVVQLKIIPADVWFRKHYYKDS